MCKGRKKIKKENVFHKFFVILYAIFRINNKND